MMFWSAYGSKLQQQATREGGKRSASGACTSIGEGNERWGKMKKIRGRDRVGPLDACRVHDGPMRRSAGCSEGIITHSRFHCDAT